MQSIRYAAKGVSGEANHRYYKTNCVLKVVLSIVTINSTTIINSNGFTSNGNRWDRCASRWSRLLKSGQNTKINPTVCNHNYVGWSNWKAINFAVSLIWALVR